MDKLPITHLPDYFTSVLKSNMQVSGQNFNGLYIYIQSQAPLLALVKKVFHEMGPQIDIGKIIKSLGWVGFRNRLANAFLQYELEGHYSEVLDSSLITDLINLEEDLKSYEVSGYSRAFLLGFYLKMTEIKRTKLNLSSLKFDLNLIPYFDFSVSRFPKVDLSYLMILQFSDFLGEKKLKDCLVNKIGFDQIYKQLSESQKETFAENLLAYGCSIGDSELFYATQV